MMKKLQTWAGYVAASMAIALLPAHLQAAEYVTPPAPQAVPTVPAENVPPGVKARRPNAAATAEQTRENAATQRTRARRQPKVQNKYKEARGQEPQLVDVPDPVDINSD